MAKKRNAQLVAEEKKKYLYENLIVACPNCWSRFKLHGMSPMRGRVVHCPVCGQPVGVGQRNSRIVSVEENDDVED